MVYASIQMNPQDNSQSYDPDHHLPILAVLYRRLLITPTLAMPLSDWIVAGYLTILLISEEPTSTLLKLDSDEEFTLGEYLG
jgi:hypothetical protein